MHQKKESEASALLCPPSPSRAAQQKMLDDFLDDLRRTKPSGPVFDTALIGAKR